MFNAMTYKSRHKLYRAAAILLSSSICFNNNLPQFRKLENLLSLLSPDPITRRICLSNYAIG